MSASFKDTADNKNRNHGLSPDMLAMARMLEDESEKKQKEILEKMGVKGISRYTHIITAKNYATKQKGITIKHLFDESNPDAGGWYFYENDKLKVKLSHPYFDHGRVLMKVQEFL